MSEARASEAQTPETPERQEAVIPPIERAVSELADGTRPTVGILGSADPAATAGLLLALQRGAGNRALHALLARSASDRAADADGATLLLRETKPKSAGVALMEANRDKLETIRAEALVRMGKLSKLEGDAKSSITAVKGRLLATSKTYDKAYENYASVIKKARLEAQNQQEWTDICVGIAIGVCVGLCAEGIVAMVAVDAAAAVAAKGLKALGKAAAKETAGEGAEAVLGKAAKAVTTVAGTDLEPGGLRPEILKMNIWKSLTEMHEKAPKIGAHSLSQGLLMANAEYAIGEIKAHASGGSGADMNEKDAIDMVLTVLGSAENAGQLDKAVDGASAKFDALKKAAESESTYDEKQMEKDIWVLWMASLKKDSNILDLDEIEDYIGPDGLGLVDFGTYTSDEDENEAIDSARSQRSDIKERRDAAIAVGSVAPKTD